MDIDELRYSFLLSKSEEEIVLDRHRAHARNLDRSLGDFTVVLDAFPIPLDEERFEVSDNLRRELEKCLVNVWSIYPCRIAFDGFAAGRDHQSRARVKRSGWITIEHTDKDGPDGRVIASIHFVQYLFHALQHVFQCYAILSINAPTYLCLTMLGCQNRRLAVHYGLENTVIDLNELEMSPLLFEPTGAEVPIQSTVRPWLDRLWQAAGLERCGLYDANGQLRSGWHR